MCRCDVCFGRHCEQQRCAVYSGAITLGSVFSFLLLLSHSSAFNPAITFFQIIFHSCTYGLRCIQTVAQTRTKSGGGNCPGNIGLCFHGILFLASFIFLSWSCPSCMIWFCKKYCSGWFTIFFLDLMLFLNLHSWWQAVDEAKNKEKTDAAAVKKKEDW